MHFRNICVCSMETKTYLYLLTFSPLTLKIQDSTISSHSEPDARQWRVLSSKQLTAADAACVCVAPNYTDLMRRRDKTADRQTPLLSQPNSCASRITLLWPPCVADVDIIFLPCGFFFLFFFFSSPNLSQPSQIGCLPYFHT